MTYSTGFESVWAAYPHYQRRSQKLLAWAVWQRRKLEPLADNVLAWIAAMKTTTDWRKDCHSYVPGLQVWLKGEDFSSRPPTQPTTAAEPRKSVWPAEQSNWEAAKRRLWDTEAYKNATLSEQSNMERELRAKIFKKVVD